MAKEHFFERMKTERIKKDIEKFLEEKDYYSLFDYYNKLNNKYKEKVSRMLEDDILSNPREIEFLTIQNGVKNPFNLDVIKLANVKFEGEYQVDNKSEYLAMLLNLANNEELSSLLSFYLNKTDEVFDCNYYRDMFKAILDKKYFDILKTEHVGKFVEKGLYALEAKEIMINPGILKSNKLLSLSPEEFPREFILTHPEVLNTIYTNNLLMRSFTADEVMKVPELLNYPDITITNGEKLSKRFILKHPEVLHTRVNNLDFILTFEDLQINREILEDTTFHQYFNFRPKIEHFLEIPELLNVDIFNYRDFQNSLLVEYLSDASLVLPYSREEQKDLFKHLLDEKIKRINENNTLGYEFDFKGLFPFLKMIEDAKGGLKEIDSDLGLTNIDEINNIFETILNIEKGINQEYAKTIESIYFNPDLVLGMHGGAARVEQYLEDGLMNRMEGRNDLVEAETPTITNTVFLQVTEDNKERPLWNFLNYSYGVKSIRTVVLGLPKQALYPDIDTEDIALWHSIGINKHDDYISYLPNNYVAGVYDTLKLNFYSNPNYNPAILYEPGVLEDGTKMVVDASFNKTRIKEL